MTTEDADRQWNQDELAEHLKKLGWSEMDIIESGWIPQGVKFIAPPAPLAEPEIAWAKEQMAKREERNA